MCLKNNFAILLVAVSMVFFSTSCDRCLDGDLYKSIPADIKAFVPSDTITSFTMVSEDGISETYILERYLDTIEGFPPDRCGYVESWDRMNVVYTSTLGNDHNLEFRLDALNDIYLSIGINWEQWISWSFDADEIAPSGYDQGYPEAITIEFKYDYTISGRTWEKVLKASFNGDDLEEWEIQEAVFATHTGLVWYRLKNGVEFFRD